MCGRLLTFSPSASSSTPAVDSSTFVETKTKNQEGQEGQEQDTRGEEETRSASPDRNDASTKPNIFFIMIDDMGYNDIGYQSIDLQGVTPNLDKLAAGGVKVISARVLKLVCWVLVCSRCAGKMAGVGGKLA